MNHLTLIQIEVMFQDYQKWFIDAAVQSHYRIGCFNFSMDMVHNNKSDIEPAIKLFIDAAVQSHYRIRYFNFSMNMVHNNKSMSI